MSKKPKLIDISGKVVQVVSPHIYWVKICFWLFEN